MRKLFVFQLAVCLTMAVTAQSADVVVVCPNQFRASLDPWIAHRESEGLSLDVIESRNTSAELQTSIQATASKETRYVVLVGDAPTIGAPCNALRQVPICYSPSKVTKAWGSTPTHSTDLFYGDFDGDQQPEAVVGRLPVDRAEQLDQLVSRIITRDQNRDYGPWLGRVQLIGGVGGFGFMADRAIESVTRTVVTGTLPTATRTSVLYASPGHLFYPPNPFTESVLANYQLGSRFWVYAGHGQVTQLDRVPQTAEGIPVLDSQSVTRLNRAAYQSPIAVMLACFTGAVDAPEDSIAEEMLLTKGGPVAVLAGSRVTMPYGNTTAAVGLIDAIYEQKLPRLGDAWHSALAEMHREKPLTKTTTRDMVDALAAIISPTGTQLTDERREHMTLYNLLGDPTLVLHHPLPATISIEPGFAAEEVVQFQVSSPIAGVAKIELDRPLGTFTTGDPNQTNIASMEMAVQAGKPIQPKVALPTDVHGAVVIRVFIKGDDSWATGAARTIIHKKKSE